MEKNRKGFTLIEIIMIIIICGIVIAVAIPRYNKLRNDATEATAQAILGTLRSANTMRFAERMVNDTKGGYTMRDVVSQAKIQGVNIASVTDTSVTVEISGNVYTFNLAPLPDVPATIGTITESTHATW